MTFYPSETVILDLANQVRKAAAAIAKKARRESRGEHPEEYNVPVEYKMSREDNRLYRMLTRAAAESEETNRPAAERYDRLKDALRTWRAAGEK